MKSQHRFELALRALDAGVWEFDLKTHSLYVSSRWKSMLGIDPAAVFNTRENWIALMHAIDRDRVLQAFTGCMNGFSKSYDIEHRMRHANGSYRWVRSQAVLTRDEHGTPLLLTGTHVDITQNKSSEIQLQKTRQELMDFIEQSAVGMSWVSTDGFILWANQTELDILQLSREDYLGHRISDFHADKMVAADLLSRLACNEDLRNFEARLVCKDGSIRHVKMTSNSLSQGGKVVHFRLFTQDITDSLRLEEQLRQSQKMDAIGQLAGGIAHDFNNLLTVINGNCQLLLQRETSGSPRRKELDVILQTGEHAAALTKQLLAFSRNQLLQPEVINLNTAVRETEQMLRRIIREDIALVSHLEPHLHSACVDPTQIKRVIVNLVVNARDAIQSHGTITIETSNVVLNESYLKSNPHARPGPFVLIKITDTGHGIDAATRLRLFEPFFTTKPRGQGTGLGLSTVYGIVKQSGGVIEVSSVPGKTSFMVYLPQVAEAPALCSIEEVPVLVSGHETILVVDDQEGIRNLVRDVLQSSGYTVLIAVDGEDALRVASDYKEPIHLLFTDVVMPKMGGKELALHLVQKRPDLKILFMSAYSHEPLIRSKIDFVVLRKPFTLNQLLTTLRTVLNSSPRTLTHPAVASEIR